VLREIASRLGVMLGNLQYYYVSRDDLLEAVIRAEFEQNQRDVAAIATAEGSPQKKLETITRYLIDVWAREGGRVYVVMSRLALHQARFRALHREIYSAFYEGLLPSA
jgi:AcrR family transcriptional regulator